MTHAVQASGYVAVDASADPMQYVHRLDRQARTGFWQAVKRHSYTLLNARPGKGLLEIGCGTGDDARALAALVAPDGHAIGLDPSATMIAEATRRSRTSDLPVRFVLGDVRHLDFDEASFDGCRAERLLQHLDQPRLAVAEMRRVLRRGGRLVIVDADYASLTIGGADPALTDDVIQARVEHFTSGRFARELPGLYVRMGLCNVRVSVKTLILRELDAATRDVMALMARAAESAGKLRAGDGRAWLRELDDANGRGQFRYAISIFTVSGEV